MAVGLAGAAIAGIPGIGLTALQGFQLGVMLGSILFPQRPSFPRTNSFRVNKVQPGSVLPRCWGRYRGAGTIIWLGDVTSDETGGNKQAPGQEVFRATLAVACCEGPGKVLKRIWLNKEIVLDVDEGYRIPWFDVDQMDPAVDWHGGSESQGPHSAIVAEVGSGDAPAYRGTAYAVFVDMPLQWIGNTLPQFEFEVDDQEPVFLSTVLTDILEACEVPASRIDVSAVSDVRVRGFWIEDEGSMDRALDALQLAYSFDLVEVAGKITAVKRGGAPSFALGWDDLGLYGEEHRALLSRGQESELPHLVEVGYSSDTEDQRLQRQTQTASRPGSTTADKLNLDLPLCLTKDEAKRLSLTRLMHAWVSREGLRAKLLPEFLDLAPGDVGTVSVELEGEVLPLSVLITSMGLEQDGSLSVQLVGDDPAIYAQQATGSDEGEGGGDLPTVGSLRFDASSLLPPLSARDAEWPTSYCWAAQKRPDWRSVYVQYYEPGTPMLRELGSITRRATMGQTESVLPADPNPWRVDETSVLDVDLFYGSLASITRDQLLGGRMNLALVGEEVISFQTATLLSGSSYRLSGLLRGRLGTEDVAGANRAAGARFVLLDEKIGAFGHRFWGAPLPSGALRARDLVAVPYGEGWPSRAELDEWFGDGALRAWAPTRLAVSVGPSEATITWMRRERVENTPDIASPIGLLYDDELYGLAVYQPGGATFASARQLGADTSLLRVGTVAGQPYQPDVATALQVASYAVPRATWDAWPRPLVLEVRQIAKVARLGYTAFGKPGRLTIPS